MPESWNNCRYGCSCESGALNDQSLKTLKCSGSVFFADLVVDDRWPWPLDVGCMATTNNPVSFLLDGQR